MTSERIGNIRHGELKYQSQAGGLTQYGLSFGDEKHSEDRKWLPQGAQSPLLPCRQEVRESKRRHIGSM